MRRSPLKRKPKSKTAEARRYHEYIAGLPCLVSGQHGVQVHHVTATIHGGRISRNDFLVVPLAPEFHQIQWGPKTSVEALGHRGFYRQYGIDLLAEAERLAAEWLI